LPPSGAFLPWRVSFSPVNITDPLWRKVSQENPNLNRSD
jgi:hypothetical protein